MEEVKKVALVTGSSSGIGANIAIDLARRGYIVIVTGRDKNKLDQVVQQCNDTHQESCLAFPIVADLSHIDQVDRLIDFIRVKFNRLDVLVNNACWRGFTTSIVNDRVIEDITRVMHTNVSIPVYLVHKCLLPLKSSDHYGVVINMSSIASQTSVPLHLYSISKACLSDLSKQLAALTESHRILSIAISPGPVLTEERPHHAAMSNLTLMNRVGTTQEVSNLVIFAIENARLFNGQELYVDGGFLARQRH